MTSPSLSPGDGPPLQEGRLFCGAAGLRYRLGPLLHRSQTALLYALSDEFGRSLVLKLYCPKPLQGEPVEQQWQRELECLRRIRHPRVLALQEALNIAGAFALVLQRADTDLERWCRALGPLPEPAAVELARQLLEGLHVIHSAGVLHLDLSPPNVLVCRPAGDSGAPAYLLSDFGISVLEQEALLLSRPSGQWAHRPPELLSPHPVAPTPRCDLYGLGLTLLHTRLGGLPCTDALPLPEVARQVFAGVYRQAAMQLNTPLGALMAALLQVDPQQRPASALEAWRLLTSAAESGSGPL